jgi:hypothetical protein
MTTPTDIDRDAPVIAHHEIDIAAPLDTVWNLHTGVDGWPGWNLEVTAAKLDGAFAPGNSFTWTSYGFTVTSTIYIVSPRRSTSSKTTPARYGAAPRKASWEPTNGGSRRAQPASTWSPPNHGPATR